MATVGGSEPRFIMVELVAIQCPHCSAPLEMQPGAELVDCPYCETSSIVSPRGAQARVPLPKAPSWGAAAPPRAHGPPPPRRPATPPTPQPRHRRAPAVTLATAPVNVRALIVMVSVGVTLAGAAAVLAWWLGLFAVRSVTPTPDDEPAPRKRIDVPDIEAR